MGAGASLHEGTAGKTSASLAALPQPQQDDLRRLQTLSTDDEALANAVRVVMAKDIGLFKQLKKPPRRAAVIFEAILLLLEMEVAPLEMVAYGESVTVEYEDPTTGESIWDHPCDEHYRKLTKQHKEHKLAQAESSGRSPDGSPARPHPQQSDQFMRLWGDL